MNIPTEAPCPVCKTIRRQIRESAISPGWLEVLCRHGRTDWQGFRAPKVSPPPPPVTLAVLPKPPVHNPNKYSRAAAQSVAYKVETDAGRYLDAIERLGPHSCDELEVIFEAQTGELSAGHQTWSAVQTSLKKAGFIVVVRDGRTRRGRRCGIMGLATGVRKVGGEWLLASE